MTKKKQKMPIDRMMDNDKLVRKFLKEYGDIEDKRFANTNQNGLAIMRGVNEYSEFYNIFQTLSGYVYDTLMNSSDDTRFASGLIRIKMSVKKQMQMQHAIKRICKNMPVEKKYFAALDDACKKATNRFTYLYEHIMPIYMESTKLCGYCKKLKEDGKTIYQDVMEYLGCEKYDFDKEKALAYLDEMVDKYQDESWVNNLKNSIERNNANEEAIEKDKKSNALEAKIKRWHSVENMLISVSRDIDREYRNSGFDGTSYPYRRLGLATCEAPYGKKCKIILLATNRCKSRTGVMYFSKDTDGYLTKALGKASVIFDEENIPDELQAKIEEYELAMVELLLN